MEVLKTRSDRVVGTRAVLRGIRDAALACVYVAEDTDTFLFQRVTRAAESAGIPVKRVPSMAELGRACGVEVAAAAAGLPRL